MRRKTVSHLLSYFSMIQSKDCYFFVRSMAAPNGHRCYDSQTTSRPQLSHPTRLSPKSSTAFIAASQWNHLEPPRSSCSYLQACAKQSMMRIGYSWWLWGETVLCYLSDSWLCWDSRLRVDHQASSSFDFCARPRCCFHICSSQVVQL